MGFSSPILVVNKTCLSCHHLVLHYNYYTAWFRGIVTKFYTLFEKNKITSFFALNFKDGSPEVLSPWRFRDALGKSIPWFQVRVVKLWGVLIKKSQVSHEQVPKNPYVIAFFLGVVCHPPKYTLKNKNQGPFFIAQVFKLWLVNLPPPHDVPLLFLG